MRSKLIIYLSLIALVLAFSVIIVGAYTRLTHAGLGCPDWPGCYGKLVLPNSTPDLRLAQDKFPTQNIELRKAWTEMAHRYAAGSLGLLIFIIGLSSYWRTKDNWPPKILSMLLILLVIFQALLGMWTVTLKLLPIVVMAHLLGGMSILACLSCLILGRYPQLADDLSPGLRKAIGFGVIIIFCQIALGGWVSSNYAGLACIGFPKCNGQWLPPLHFFEGFNLLSPLGINYQGGVLENEARVTIQVIHRIGAIITASYLFILSILVWRSSSSLLKNLSLLVIALLVLQLLLGIINVQYLLPLPIAVAHTAVAALLLALEIMMFSLSKRRKVHAS